MNYCEYSALVIMGWKKESLPDPFSGGLMWDYVAPDYSREFAVDTWHPDINRDQLWLVIQAYRKWMNTIPCSVSTIPPPANLGEGFYHMAMTDPALALKAIVEAHIAHKVEV